LCRNPRSTERVKGTAVRSTGVPELTQRSQFGNDYVLATLPRGRILRHAGIVTEHGGSACRQITHPVSEMGLELRADGANALLTLFRQETGTAAEGSESETGPGTHGEATELGTLSVEYDELLDRPEEVMARVLSFLPRG
jgi:hypothetical protein